MRATDAFKDSVNALTREAVNFRHEVLMLIIDRDTAEVGYRGRLSR